MENFKPIKRINISDEIIDQIISMIHKGTLKPGDRLPSERELTDAFKVGRSSIREALKSLETTGIIKRNSKGTIVNALEEGDYSILLFKDNMHTIHEVFEARKAIEVGIIGLAAQRATPEQIREISETIIDSMDVHKMIASDISFHKTLVKTSQNSILSYIYNMVMGLLFQTHKYYFLIEASSNRMPIKEREVFINSVNKYHKNILKAVESHDVSAAKISMEAHFDYAERVILREVLARNPASELESSHGR
ncbi:MAG: FadR/GntR family transcriptional regulator [Chloroflexi bacterium]|nr:FadR/GntR family transcriptional regulator [Chloroflexota bacterium]